ncbi:TPA: glycoside hydrolase family 36 protein, partial [Vibrio alginolyticus]
NKGMEFGLWVEPEMVSQDSNLYRQHPDWVLSLQGYDQPSGRWQYVLDLQNKDCFNYLFDRLNDLLTRYNIGYLKWDMNRELVQPGHQGKPAVHGQTKALYRLLDELYAAHPEVEIESCSSGGGRIDFEILKRTHRFWASDCNDALERQAIQRGMSYFFPPEVMGAHIGPAECHSTNRRHAINMRGVTALSGHMGVELDPVKESAEEKQAFAHYIQLHKQYRDLLHSGRAFRIDPADHSQNIYGVENGKEMLITVCQLAMPNYALPSPLR